MIQQNLTLKFRSKIRNRGFKPRFGKLKKNPSQNPRFGNPRDFFPKNREKKISYLKK